MLVKLGKYLRILGYDARWDARLRTHELILQANQDGRVFLTRNTQLPQQYPPVTKVLLIVDEDAALQLRQVVSAFDLEPQQFLFSKCVQCNVPLETVSDKRDIESRIHPNVFARHRRFFTCRGCGTVFWHGSHVRNTCRKLGLPMPEPDAETDQPTTGS